MAVNLVSREDLERLLKEDRMAVYLVSREDLERLYFTDADGQLQVNRPHLSMLSCSAATRAEIDAIIAERDELRSHRVDDREAILGLATSLSNLLGVSMTASTGNEAADSISGAIISLKEERDKLRDRCELVCDRLAQAIKASDEIKSKFAAETARFRQERGELASRLEQEKQISDHLYRICIERSTQIKGLEDMLAAKVRDAVISHQDFLSTDLRVNLAEDRLKRIKLVFEDLKAIISEFDPDITG